MACAAPNQRSSRITERICRIPANNRYEAPAWTPQQGAADRSASDEARRPARPLQGRQFQPWRSERAGALTLPRKPSSKSFGLGPISRRLEQQADLSLLIVRAGDVWTQRGSESGARPERLRAAPTRSVGPSSSSSECFS